jgi:uncharacterized protein YqhQ
MAFAVTSPSDPAILSLPLQPMPRAKLRNKAGKRMAEGPMSVGGQAILEGVMMRSPNSLAIAVRRASGEIVVKEDRWVSIWERARFLRKPFLRGAVVLFEAMHNGVKALSFSADQAARDQDPVPASADAVPAAQTPLTGLAITGTIVVSVAFAFALFAALPHFITWLAGTLLGNASLASGKDLSFQVVDGIVKICVLVGYMALISKMPDIARVFQFHGAEHKSIFCYEEGKPLTVANAKTYITLHPRCGTSFLLITVVTSIVLFSAVFPFLPEVSSTKWLNQLAYVFVKLPLMFPVAGIAYEMTRLSAKFPNNPIVKIALVALQMTLRREQALKSGAALAEQAEPVVFADYAAFLAATAAPVNPAAFAA